MIKNPFIIIPGPRKCGTTTLSEIIKRDESVVWPSLLEPDFFMLDEKTVKDNLDWYLKLYSHKKGTLYFDGSTHYFHSNRAIKNLKKYMSDVKIIIILRDPVKRTHSAFWHMKKFVPSKDKRTFTEILSQIKGPFPEDIINSENKLLRRAIQLNKIDKHSMKKGAEKKFGSRFPVDLEDPYCDYKYFQNSIYSKRVEEWCKLHKKVKIVFLEELIKKPKPVIYDVYDFLGLKEKPLEILLPESNKTWIPNRRISKTKIGHHLRRGLMKQKKVLQNSKRCPRCVSKPMDRLTDKLLNYYYHPRPSIPKKTYSKARNLLQYEYDYWISKNSDLEYLWKR